MAQVGEGADELFCGYPWWQRFLALQRPDHLPVPRLSKRPALPGCRPSGRRTRLRYEALRRGSLGQPVFWGGAEAFTQAQKERLLSPRLRRAFADFTSWEALAPTYERFRTQAWDQSDLNWMTYADLNLGSRSCCSCASTR